MCNGKYFTRPMLDIKFRHKGSDLNSRRKQCKVMAPWPYVDISKKKKKSKKQNKTKRFIREELFYRGSTWRRLLSVPSRPRNALDERVFERKQFYVGAPPRRPGPQNVTDREKGTNGLALWPGFVGLSHKQLIEDLSSVQINPLDLALSTWPVQSTEDTKSQEVYFYSNQPNTKVGIDEIEPSSSSF